MLTQVFYHSAWLQKAGMKISNPLVTLYFKMGNATSTTELTISLTDLIKLRRTAEAEKKMLDGRTDINTSDKSGESPLHAAI
jgi:ankyrin repeat protein